MNQWVKKSIILAKSHGYLDQLAEVYPVKLSLDERLTGEEIKNIAIAFRSGRNKDLISVLLNLSVSR